MTTSLDKNGGPSHRRPTPSRTPASSNETPEPTKPRGWWDSSMRALSILGIAWAVVALPYGIYGAVRDQGVYSQRVDHRRAEIRADYAPIRFTVTVSGYDRADGWNGYDHDTVTLLGHTPGGKSKKLTFTLSCIGTQPYPAGATVTLYASKKYPDAPWTAVRNDHCENLADGQLPDNDWPDSSHLPLLQGAGLFGELNTVILVMAALIPALIGVTHLRRRTRATSEKSDR